MEQDTGAVRLMRTLHQRGVRMCFANPGTTEVGASLLPMLVARCPLSEQCPEIK